MCVLKMKFLPSAVQKLSSEQTDRQTRLKLLPTAYADGNYKALKMLVKVSPGDSGARGCFSIGSPLPMSAKSSNKFPYSR